jgi:hypothetical protein
LITYGIVRVQKFSPCATVYDSLSDLLTLKRRSSVRRKSLRTFAENFFIHAHNTIGYQDYLLGERKISGRMAKLADAIALGAIGATLGGSNPLPPIENLGENVHLALVLNKYCAAPCA